MLFLSNAETLFHEYYLDRWKSLWSYCELWWAGKNACFNVSTPQNYFSETTNSVILSAEEGKEVSSKNQEAVIFG